MSNVKDTKTIGAMNGPWALLFKFTQIASAVFVFFAPFIIWWAVWVTENQMRDDFFINMGDRYTKQDGLKDEMNNRNFVRGEFEEHALEHLRLQQDIRVMQDNQIRILLEIEKLNKDKNNE